MSPLLANMFLHFAFDQWMREQCPDVPFERYADDIVVHCRTEKQARWMLERVSARLRHCKLELHPDKTVSASRRRVAGCSSATHAGVHDDQSRVVQASGCLAGEREDAARIL